MKINLGYGVEVTDTYLSSLKTTKFSRKLDSLTWEQLIKYAYKRRGWTKETFVSLLMKDIEKDNDIMFYNQLALESSYKS